MALIFSFSDVKDEKFKNSLEKRISLQKVGVR